MTAADAVLVGFIGGGVFMFACILAADWWIHRR